MRVGNYHTFQCPPWMNAEQVYAEELARIPLAEELGFDSIWVPEQHFYPYCLCGDALQMAAYVLGITKRVRVATGIVNVTFTHPLRFAERCAILDRLGKGRVDIGIGRGYQWPQYEVMGVEIDATREIFDEVLDITLAAWEPKEFTYHGKHFNIPPVRLWPTPERRPDEVLLHACASALSTANSIDRKIPAIFSNFIPIADEAANFARYRADVERSVENPTTILNRATVMRYAFLAPTRAEARESAREAFEWHMKMLTFLTSPPSEKRSEANDLYDPDKRAEMIPDLAYEQFADEILLFDDPPTCRDKLLMLKDAGVQNIVLWMGVGGASNEAVTRSMRLFAKEVLPALR
jgi:alkanesulfonate monooxygenase SsuD/methylene tetrahydromethanopterin reductase-like flavin-dependent oxidoreductase (luciferase family)